MKIEKQLTIEEFRRLEQVKKNKKNRKTNLLRLVLHTICGRKNFWKNS
jgi:hypothetical protein